MVTRLVWRSHSPNVRLLLVRFGQFPVAADALPLGIGLARGRGRDFDVLVQRAELFELARGITTVRLVVQVLLGS